MGPVLVVAAHPDDEVLGCGGTIARLSQEGYGVYIAILGEGITSRHGQQDQVQVEILHKCSQQVAKLLGVKDLFTYNLPDNRFDTVPLLNVIKIIEELVEYLQPETIYTHHSDDLNIDHMVVHRAVLTSARPLTSCPVREIYTFEVASSTEWGVHPTFYPNVFVDIHSTLETKIRAMSLYESEVRKFPHPRSPKALWINAHHRGSMVGLEAAEAFKLIRSIRHV